MDQQVEHIVALPTDLEASFDPIKLRQLEELGLLEGAEQVTLVLGFGALMVQAVENPALQELLVADTHFNRVSLWAVLLEPRADEWDITGTSGAPSSLVERSRGVIEINTAGGVLCIERLLC